ncbi:MAG TPA: CDP-alcohol phosphatidyltransferase family protein [Streptosporangiaceae bacterium]|nr:CDP-alcohol phosphatidyltransferase family protein [Streptosporangiaceae bacterium]
MLKVLRPAIARVLTPVGQVLARTPITPNALTIIGTIGMSAGALTLFPTGHLFAGVMVCTGFVPTDMLDGTLARIKGTTGRFGAFLDSTMDRIADAAVFVGLAAWFVLGGHDKVLAGVAVYCLVAGALVSYAKARAESVGLKCDVGFAERTERLLIALVATGLAGLGVPYVLPIGLWLLAAVSTVTFGQRVVAARRSAALLEAQSGEAADGTRAARLNGGAARELDDAASGGLDDAAGGGLDGGAAGSGSPAASPARAGRGASAAPTADHRDAAPGG